MPANKFANILFQAVSECAYPFMLCYFGEDVIHEVRLNTNLPLRNPHSHHLS